MRCWEERHERFFQELRMEREAFSLSFIGASCHFGG
jgi:hypothetical protein